MFYTRCYVALIIMKKIEALEELPDGVLKQIQLDMELEDDEKIEDLEEIDEQFDFVGNNIEQVESTNALSVKRNDLLSMAAEMQKSRDNFVEKGEKPKFPLNR